MRANAVQQVAGSHSRVGFGYRNRKFDTSRARHRAMEGLLLYAK